MEMQEKLSTHVLGPKTSISCKKRDTRMKYWVLYVPTQHSGENLQSSVKNQIPGEQQLKDPTT